MQAPCKYCSERVEGCHSRCPVYKVYHHVRANELKENYNKQEVYHNLNRLKCDGIRKVCNDKERKLYR